MKILKKKWDLAMKKESRCRVVVGRRDSVVTFDQLRYHLFGLKFQIGLGCLPASSTFLQQLAVNFRDQIQMKAQRLQLERKQVDLVLGG